MSSHFGGDQVLVGRQQREAARDSSAMSAAAASQSPSSTSVSRRAATLRLSMPQPMVALPCGSMSMSSTRRCVAASDAARLTAVVVLPTPPF